MISHLGERHPIEHLIDVVHKADQFKHQQLVAMWPELADALVRLIEGTTEHDAPRAWHATSNGVVLHPDEVTVVLNQAGQPHAYIVGQQP